MTAPLRMIGLTRKSKGDDEGTHVDQRSRIEAKARAEGFELVDVLSEKGVSGAKNWRKRELGQSIEAVREGRADGIIVAYMDRITREKATARAEIWEAFKSAGAVFIACDGIDSRAPGSELLYDIQGAVARYQVDLTGTKSDAGRGRSVMENNVHGGSIAPWGYVWTWVKDATKGKKHGPLAAAPGNRVQEAFEDIADGISHPAFRRKYGVKMSNVIARGDVYLGVATSGTFKKAGAHPALVDEDTYRRAHHRFKKADTGAGRPAKAPRPPALLPADVIRCGTCGHGLTRQPSPNGDYYRCQFASCERSVSISCNGADPRTIEQALAWHAEDTALHIANPGEGLADLLAKLEAARAELAEVERMQAAGELSPVAYAGARSAADKTAADVGRRVADAEIAEGWRSMTTARVRERLEGNAEETRGFLREFIRVNVLPGRRENEDGKRVIVASEERLAFSRVYKRLGEDVPEAAAA